MTLQEAQMAAMIRGHQSEVGIAAESRMVEHREGDEGIVLGLDEQCGDADAIEEVLRRLRRVVVVSGTEPKRWRGELVVDRVDRPRIAELLLAISPGGDQTLAHALDEAAFVQGVVALSDTSCAGSQID